MREVRPLRALADQRDLRVALDRHLVLDEGRDPLGRLAGQLAEARAAVAEDPRIAVLVGAEPAAHAERTEQLGQRLQRVPLARVLVVRGDLLHGRVRLRVLDLEPRHEHPAAPVARRARTRSGARSG